MKQNSTQFVYGIHAVKNILVDSPNKIIKINIIKNITNPELWEILKVAKKLKIIVNMYDRDFFKKKYGNIKHQGVVAFFGMYEYLDFYEFENTILTLEKDEKKPNVVFADSISDPHNLGAILRTSYLLGVKWVFVPKKNGAPITEVVLNSSTGAAFKLNIVKIKMDYRDFSNKMKELGYTIFGLEAGGDQYVQDIKLEKDNPFMLITGSEGFGMNRTLAKNTDKIVKLSMIDDDEINSYNTSVALSIALYSLVNNQN